MHALAGIHRLAFIVIALSGLACGEPTALADGLRGLILFSKGSNRASELFVIRPDGTGLRQLTHNDYWDSQAHWSPDGRRIVFVSERDSVPGDPLLKGQIHVMDADGSNVRRLTNEASPPTGPRWSPDGTRITFNRSGPDGWQHIHIMNADGSQIRALTTGESVDYSADWSPDGTKILFLSQRPPLDFSTMYVMNADGTDQQMVAGDYACTDNVNEARWSPDGARIAYSCGATLYVINADGTDRTTIGTPTLEATVHAYPAWSPDGRRIAFTGGTQVAWDVYVIPATGGSRSRLTNDVALDLVFDWKRPR